MRYIWDCSRNNFYFDAGEIGAGHSVTALYEIKLKKNKQGKMALISIRFKDPDTDQNIELKREIHSSQIKKAFNNTTPTFRLAATVAEFAEILRKSYWAKDHTLESLLNVIHTLPNPLKNKKRLKSLLD
jgi:Ca-activated chloride channel family protein